MPYYDLPNWGDEWFAAFGPQPVTDHNVAAIRNTSSDHLLVIRELFATTSNAALFHGRGAAQASLAGTSAGVVVPVWAKVGYNRSNASFALPGKCYYGTSAAGTGIAATNVITPDIFTHKIDAGRGEPLPGDIPIAPGFAFVLRAVPSAKGDVTVSARIRWLGPGLW